MSDYYDFGKDSCNLPNECDCSQCNYWSENGWDVSRTPDWHRKSFPVVITGDSNELNHP